MTGYTKLFNSILTSTIWSQDSDTKVVWITMLAMADQHGKVEATAPGLAKMAGVPEDKVKQVLDMLSKPDDVSRSLDNEGRRIERVNGGYTLLNYKRYRNQRVAEDRKAYMRKYMREYMQKRRQLRNVKPMLSSVKRKLAQAEAEAYTYTLVPEEGVLGGETNRSKISQISENQKPKTQEPEPAVFQSQELRSHPRRCLVPDCVGQARTGLPGRAALFCSEACYQRAQKIDPTNFPPPEGNPA